MIKRRTFLQLLTMPAILAFWPRAAMAQTTEGPWYTDDLGALDPSILHDSNLATGKEYQP